MKILQDSDCNWYWIPSDLVDKFLAWNESIYGIEYMDDPELFENFDSEFSKFRTYGSPDNVPEYYRT